MGPGDPGPGSTTRRHGSGVLPELCTLRAALRIRQGQGGDSGRPPHKTLKPCSARTSKMSGHPRGCSPIPPAAHGSSTAGKGTRRVHDAWRGGPASKGTHSSPACKSKA